MPELEHKSVTMEFKDLDLKKGEVIVKHSIYDSLDIVKDIARKGMFNKSWAEQKMSDDTYDIYAYINHDTNQAWGKTLNVFEDNTGAFTHIKSGKHTLGRDALDMIDEGIARKASFGFYTMKANKLPKGIRELKEVKHPETSILTKLSAHPQAGVTAFKKSFDGMVMDIKSLNANEQSFLQTYLAGSQKNLESMVSFAGTLDPTSDLYTGVQYWISRVSDAMSDMKCQLRYGMKAADVNPETKDLIEKMKKFCTNSRASDETIQGILAEIKSYEDSILSIDTVDTQLITEPSISGDNETKSAESSMAEQLLLLTLNF